MTDVDSKLPIICDAETCKEKPKFPEKEKVSSKTTLEQENNSTGSQANTVNQGYEKFCIWLENIVIVFYIVIIFLYWWIFKSLLFKIIIKAKIAIKTCM